MGPTGPSRESGETPTAGPSRAHGNGFVADLVVNAKRWGRKALRNRFFLVATLGQPLVFFLLFTQVFGAVATSSLGGGASGPSYETYLLPAIAIQVALASAGSSGIGLVNDVESGMFEKVLVSPMNRTAVFLGKSAAEIALIVVQILLVLALGVAIGARIQTGLAGVVGVALVGVLFSVWFTAYSNVVAVLTRDQESTVLAANLLQFPLLFLSTAFLPLSVLPDWIQTIAVFNPVTYGVDAARSLVLGRDVLDIVAVTGFGGMWDAIVPAVLVLAIVDLVFGALAVAVLRRASRATTVEAVDG